MKYSCCWLLFLSICVLSIVDAKTESEAVKVKVDDESESHKVLDRISREAVSTTKNVKKCKYRKGPWGPCDPQMKIKKRVFTLKKGDKSNCEPTKTIQKECKIKGNKEKGGKNKNGGNVEKQERQKEKEKNRENRKKMNADNNNKKNNRGGGNGNGNGGKKEKKERNKDKKSKTEAE